MLHLTHAAALLAAPLALILVLLAFRRTRTRLPRWRLLGSCGVRLVLVALLTLAMTTPVLTRRTEQPFCTIFVVDVSDSVPPAAWERALPELRRAWNRETDAGNLCGLVAFAGRAEPLIAPGRDPFPVDVERIAHRIALLKHAAAAAEGGDAAAREGMSRLQEWRERLDVSSTDLARGLAAAHAQYREGAANRIVLVTDGRDTERDPDAIDVPPGLLAVRLDPAAARDVAVAGVDAPLAVRAGAPFDVRVTLHASHPSDVNLSVLLDGRPIRVAGTDRPWPIRKSGRATVILANLQQDRAFEPGLRRLEVVATAAGDTESWNNVGAAAVTVTGRPRVLLVEGDPDEGASLAAWLRAQDIEFVRESPDRTAARNGILEEFVAVVLAGVERDALSDRLIRGLSEYVERSGGGLWVVGSPRLGGGKGYARSGLEKLLPVTFTEEAPAAGGARKPPERPKPPAPAPPRPEPGAPKRVLAPTVAMLFVVDKSGSMAGRNIALVKAACIASARTLTRKDFVGVLAFDVRPHWVLRFTEADRQKYIEQLVGRLYADGGTHVYPALVEALAAFRKDPRARTAAIKHVILLSDGDTQPADFETVVSEMAKEGVTVSTVCVSAPRFNPTLMSRIAGWGRGKFNFTDSFSRVPEIFVQEAKRILAALPRGKEAPPPAAPPKPDPPAPKPPPEPKKETPPRPLAVVSREPHEVLRGIETDRLPPLTGLLPAAPRKEGDVSVPLSTTDGKPVLALRRVGLGKTAVWTSDLAGRWSREWVSWKDSGKLFAQLLRYVSSAAPDTEFASRVYVKRSNGTAAVRIDPGPANEALAALDAETRTPLALTRRSDGGHELNLPLRDDGRMSRVLLQHGDGKRLLVGALQAYDPEFAPPDPRHDLFAGAVRPVAWEDLPSRMKAARVPGEDRVDLAPWFILGALLLLPIDVALRRFNI